MTVQVLAGCRSARQDHRLARCRVRLDLDRVQMAIAKRTEPNLLWVRGRAQTFRLKVGWT